MEEFDKKGKNEEVNMKDLMGLDDKITTMDLKNKQSNQPLSETNKILVIGS